MENYLVTYRFEDGTTNVIEVVAGSFQEALVFAGRTANRQWSGLFWVTKVEIDYSWAEVAS